MQPKTSPAHHTHAADLEGEGCPLAKEGDTLAQIINAEAVPSWQHPQAPTQGVHAQTIGTEPSAILGELGATKWQPGDPSANTPKGVAHPEPDLMPGEDIDPNANAPMHLEGLGPEVMLEEGGIAGKNASVKGDRDPLVKLQESGVSHLAMPEEVTFLTSSLSSPSPTTSDAARTQHLPAVNTGMSAIPIIDHGVILEPPPHDMPLPNKGAESLDHHPSEQSQAATKVGGPLESLLGKASQHTMGQMVLTSARALEGKMPIREAHSHPPDFPDPQGHGSIIWEPASVVPKACVHVHKARRPILDEGARMCAGPWPNLGIVSANPDTCLGSASLLEGEQNIISPYVGSKQYASPCTPQISSSSPSSFLPPDTLAHENLLGEGAATEWCTTKDLGPKHLKPPNSRVEDLTKSGGASPSDDSPVPFGSPGDPDSLGFAFMVVDTDAKGVEPLRADAHERGGALPVTGTAPAPTESTTSVKPASKAEKAIATKPEAPVPWAQGKAGCGVERHPQEGKRELDALPPQGKRMVKAAPLQGDTNCKVEMSSRRGESAKCTKALPPEGERECGATLQGVAKCKLECPEVLPQRGRCKPKVLPPDGERECGTTPQGNLNKAKRGPDQPP